MDDIELKKSAAHFNDINVIIVFDHARAGNMFFTRIFDQHPEVLCIPFICYLYAKIFNFFGDNNKMPGNLVYDMLIGDGDTRQITCDLTPDIELIFRRSGDDPTCSIDRSAVCQVLKKLLRDRPIVTRKDVVVAVYLAYAKGINRDPQKVKYLLINDTTRNHEKAGDKNNAKLFRDIQEDNKKLKIIHLIRDPRANFASIRHQYVNQYGNMYPLKVRKIWETTGINSIWLWILVSTIGGARALLKWQKQIGNNNFYRIRNEDLNLNFIITMQKLVDWLRISWDESWSKQDYVPTSCGVPWKSISAYSNFYQRNIHGPLKNEPEGKDRFPGPNREVTERWKKKLCKREIKFLEIVYGKEIQEFGYEFLYPRDQKQKVWALLGIILPLAGEIPRWGWWIHSARIKNKIAFLITFVFSYIFSRIMFFIKYFSGEFNLNGEN